MFDFPSSPSLNQTVTATNGIVYIWDGTKWVSSTAGNPFPVAPTQSYGNNTTSVATTAFVQTAVAPAFNDSGRNCIHNSMFNIAQRGAGPFTVNNGYTMDRWQLSVVGDTDSITQIALSDTDRAQIGDEAAIYALQDVFTGTSGAGNLSQLIHSIENVRRLSGKTVIVSFWAKASSGTPALGVRLYQSFGSGGSPSASLNTSTVTTPSLTASWQRYVATIAIPSAAGKTFGTTAGTDLTGLVFGLSSGATNQATLGVGVQSGTVQIWGVQVEIAQPGQTLPTILEKPDPQQDLLKCQRFYQAAPSTVVYGYQASAADVYRNFYIALPTTMRASPTITATGSGFTPTVQASVPSAIMFNYNSGNTTASYYVNSYTASADF